MWNLKSTCITDALRHSTGGPAASIAGSCSADGFFDAAAEMAKPMLASRSSSIGSADEPLIATATNDRVIGRKDKICAEVLLGLNKSANL